MRIIGSIAILGTFLLLAGCYLTPSPPPPTRPVDLQDSRSTTELPPLGPHPAPPDGLVDLIQPGFPTVTRELVEEENGPLSLTVEDAVLTALRHNRSLVVQRFEPLKAGTFIAAELAVFDPVIAVSGTVSNERRQSWSQDSLRFFSLDQEEYELSLGGRQKLPSGTEAELEVSQGRTKTGDATATDEARIGLNLTQALLRGAGIEANLAAVREAQAGELASVYNLRGFTETLVATVENSFWDYALASRQEEIFAESVSLAEQQRKNAQSRIAVGQIAETEAIVVDAELALRKQQLIDARNSRQRARLSLLRLLNPPSADGWSRQILLSEDAVVPEVRLGSPEEHVALARRLRPDLNEARLKARQGQLALIQTADGLLPRLDLFLSLGKSGYARSFSESFKELDGPGYDILLGGELEMPAGNRQAKALDVRAQASYEQALASIANLEQLVSLEVRTAILEVDRSLQQIDASRASRLLQEEVVRTEYVRFRVGTATALDVARVQRDLLASRINEVAAIVDYRRALIDLYLLDGTLLLRRGIDSPGAEEVILADGNN